MLVDTGAVEIMNVAEVAPCGTVTDAGTEALVLLTDNWITEPPTGAGADKVTVPVIDAPPTTEYGETDRFSSVAWLMVSVAELVCEATFAVIVEVIGAPTLNVVIVKLAEVAPAAIITDEGNDAYPLLALSATITPPVGAGEPMVTVPVTEVPPITELGERERVKAGAGLTVTNSVIVVEPCVPRILAVTELAGLVVVSVKVPVEDPAGIVTEIGVNAFVLFDERKIIEPPGPAVPFTVTVPIADVPPVIVLGTIERLTSTAGVIVSVVVLEIEPWVAVIVAVEVEATPLVLTVNVPVICPAATVIVAGTDALELFDESETITPPGPAADARVTDPTELVPPGTDAGVTPK